MMSRRVAVVNPQKKCNKPGIRQVMIEDFCNLCFLCLYPGMYFSFSLSVSFSSLSPLASLLFLMYSLNPMIKSIASPAPLNIQDKAMALELEYSTNYTVKQLSQILDYYEISKRKLRKDEMVQILVMFETDAQNASLVSRRKRLWANAQELREDPYFAKFIVFNI